MKRNLKFEIIMMEKTPNQRNFFIRIAARAGQVMMHTKHAFEWLICIFFSLYKEGNGTVIKNNGK